MIHFSDTTFHDHVASPSIKKALFNVLSVGSKYFQSIWKGTCPQPMFRQRYRVRAVLGILLPSQVNQEVPPQYSASRRIFSPLTTSQRVPYHCMSVRGLCYTGYFQSSQRKCQLFFCNSCRSQSATCNLSGQGHICPRASQYSQHIYSRRTGKFRGPGLTYRHTNPLGKRRKQAKR